MKQCSGCGEENGWPKYLCLACGERFQARIAELEQAVREALVFRHDELESLRRQVDNWERKEISRAVCCNRNEEAAKLWKRAAKHYREAAQDWEYVAEVGTLGLAELAELTRHRAALAYLESRVPHYPFLSVLLEEAMKR